MTIFDVMNSCSELKKSEVRNIDEESADFVVANETLSLWQQKFNDLLGTPIKQPHESAKFEAKAISKPFGGIQKDQTLYARQFTDHCIITMFWPWQNNKFTTIKVFSISKPVFEKMIKPGMFSNLF